MPRTARENQISHYYHVIVQGDEKKFIFKKDKAKLKYLQLLMKNSERNNIQILAYCIMSNHAHILAHTQSHSNLSKMMLQTGTSYGLYYNKHRQNVGHVFRDRFKSEVILNASHLANCIKYIHENPLKANLVKSPAHYTYSSYNDYIHKIGSYSNMIALKIFSPEYLTSLTLPSSTLEKFNFLEETPAFENIEKVFAEIISNYDLNDLTQKQICEIYDILSKRCNIQKKAICKLLNISYYHLSKFLKTRS